MLQAETINILRTSCSGWVLGQVRF